MLPPQRKFFGSIARPLTPKEKINGGLELSQFYIGTFVYVFGFEILWHVEMMPKE